LQYQQFDGMAILEDSYAPDSCGSNIDLETCDQDFLVFFRQNAWSCASTPLTSCRRAQLSTVTNLFLRLPWVINFLIWYLIMYLNGVEIAQPV
jgi:hypothetical protein